MQGTEQLKQTIRNSEIIECWLFARENGDIYETKDNLATVKTSINSYKNNPNEAWQCCTEPAAGQWILRKKNKCYCCPVTKEGHSGKVKALLSLSCLLKTKYYKLLKNVKDLNYTWIHLFSIEISHERLWVHYTGEIDQDGIPMYKKHPIWSGRETNRSVIAYNINCNTRNTRAQSTWAYVCIYSIEISQIT